MSDIDRVEADQRREQPDVGLGQVVTEQKAPVGEPLLKPIERFEQREHRFFIGGLRGREARLIDAVVERVVDPSIDRVDVGAQRLRVVVAGSCSDLIELRIQHPDDLGGFVIDDGAPVLVPQHRNCGAAGVVRIRSGVDLMQEFGMVHRIRDDAGAIGEGPAVIQHQPVRHRHRDLGFEPFQHPHDQRAVRPGAGEADIEVVAAGFGLEAADAGRTGAAVDGDPVAERRVLAHEAAAGRLGRIPDVLPSTFNEQSHVSLLSVSL